MRTSIPGSGVPTVPTWKRDGSWHVTVAVVSVRPYPWQTKTPTEWKNSSMAGERGAPAHGKSLDRPPKRARTFELLMTSPVRPIEIVVGKYLAALVVMAVSIGIVAVFPVLLSFFAKGMKGGSAVEWQTVGTVLLGLFLLGAMSMAIGLFVSALTESVIVAALVSLIVLLALWVVTIFTLGAEGPMKELASGLSASDHLMPFLQGRIELKDVVYYLSFVALGLWLTDRAIEGHRWA